MSFFNKPVNICFKLYYINTLLRRSSFGSVFVANELFSLSRMIFYYGLLGTILRSRSGAPVCLSAIWLGGRSGTNYPYRLQIKSPATRIKQ
ncbi:MAG TPA: hypothetical protein DHW42_05715 [Candidatus Marinimicrobia bacterium]|nr:hypothetical protein [Candidatus Neomarinimicrobiota bacterium]